MNIEYMNIEYNEYRESWFSILYKFCKVAVMEYTMILYF